MKELSSEHEEYYYKYKDKYIHIITRRDTWEVVPREIVLDHNVFIGEWTFKYNQKSDWTTRKFKACHCMIGDL